MNEHRLEHPEDATGAADADALLLKQFASSHDEQAFRALVERHSRLVLGVCRRMLHDEHDAEEAFQATFMVLAKKAARVRVGGSLGPWLYGVAYRTALRAAHKKQRRREEPLIEEMMGTEDVFCDVVNSHRQRALDEELNRLPEKYRVPLVMHYLEGKTNKQIEQALNLSVRTIEGRQRRGKELLRRRLAHHKVSLPLAAVAVASSSASAGAATIEPLITATVESSLSYAAGETLAGNTLEPLNLAQQEIVAMSSLLTTSTAAAVLTLAVLGTSLSIAGDGPPAASPRDQPLTLETLAAAPAKASDFEDEFAQVPQVDVSKSKASDGAENPFDKESGREVITRVPIDKQAATDDTAADGNSGVVDLLERPAAEKKIVAQLSNQTQMEFFETELGTAIEALEALHGIKIVLDTRALEEVAISANTLVTKELRGITLRSALRLLLSDMDLTYIIRDEVLLITSEQEVENFLETHIYYLGDYGVTPEEAVEVLQEAIAADTWEANGGNGQVKTLEHGIVVTQRQPVHEKIVAFLRQLKRYSQQTREKE